MVREVFLAIVNVYENSTLPTPIPSSPYRRARLPSRNPKGTGRFSAPPWVSLGRAGALAGPPDLLPTPPLGFERGGLEGRHAGDSSRVGFLSALCPCPALFSPLSPPPAQAFPPGGNPFSGPLWGGPLQPGLLQRDAPGPRLRCQRRGRGLPPLHRLRLQPLLPQAPAQEPPPGPPPLGGGGGPSGPGACRWGRGEGEASWGSSPGPGGLHVGGLQRGRGPGGGQAARVGGHRGRHALGKPPPPSPGPHQALSRGQRERLAFPPLHRVGRGFPSLHPVGRGPGPVPGQPGGPLHEPDPGPRPPFLRLLLGGRHRGFGTSPGFSPSPWGSS
jgi:hypothetical protein